MLNCPVYKRDPSGSPYIFDPGLKSTSPLLNINRMGSPIRVLFFGIRFVQVKRDFSPSA